MNKENERAAQRAHENVGRPSEDYDDEGRPAAARARDHAERDAGATSSSPGEDDDEA